MICEAHTMVPGHSVSNAFYHYIQKLLGFMAAQINISPHILWAELCPPM